MNEVQAPEQVDPKPLSFKMTPSQQEAFHGLRRALGLSRVQLIDAALEMFFRAHNAEWPPAARRTP